MYLPKHSSALSFSIALNFQNSNFAWSHAVNWWIKCFSSVFLTQFQTALWIPQDLNLAKIEYFSRVTRGILSKKHTLKNKVILFPLLNGKRNSGGNYTILLYTQDAWSKHPCSNMKTPPCWKTAATVISVHLRKRGESFIKKSTWSPHCMNRKEFWN